MMYSTNYCGNVAGCMQTSWLTLFVYIVTVQDYGSSYRRDDRDDRRDRDGERRRRSRCAQNMRHCMRALLLYLARVVQEFETATSNLLVCAVPMSEAIEETATDTTRGRGTIEAGGRGKFGCKS